MEINRYQLDLGTGETCAGCDDEVFIVVAGDGTAKVDCGCSSATVLVAA